MVRAVLLAASSYALVRAASTHSPPVVVGARGAVVALQAAAILAALRKVMRGREFLGASILARRLIRAWIQAKPTA